MKRVKKPSVRHVKWGVVILALAVILVVGSLIYNSLSGPSEGLVNNGVASSTGAQSDRPLSQETKNVRGKYVSFSYPANFKPVTASKPGGTVLENFAFADRSNLPPANLNVSVLQLPTGRLADEGSYHYRSQYPSRYKAETWAVGGASVPLMEDLTGGYAKVAFVIHKEMVAEVSVSCASSGSADNLDAELRATIINLKWL